VTINEQLAAEVTRERETARANYEHMERQISGLRGECEQLRREVPLESTREGLKNAVAKLQEVAMDRDRVLNELAAIVAEANKSGRCGGDPVALIKQGHADWVAMEGMERQLEAYSSLSNARAQEIEVLKGDVARERDRGNRINAEYEAHIKKIMDTANKLGRTDYEAVDAFMERQALRLAALESTITAKCDELAKETAKIKPLEALYKTLKGWQENDHIIGYGLTIDTAINKATEALSQLTA